MIELNEGIRAVYFLSGKGSDWLAGVNKNEDGTFKMQWRFRYANPDNPDGLFDMKDVSKWYGCDVDGPESKVLKTLQTMMDALLGKGYVPKGGISCKLIRRTMTLDQFIDEFQKLPFVHMKPETAR